ncbi:MAG: hypothetical protein JNK82_25970 [Myxococcaceae bacterium]|nr:hypothetical protein [Myxococcaceae bacterium]
MAKKRKRSPHREKDQVPPPDPAGQVLLADLSSSDPARVHRALDALREASEALAFYEEDGGLTAKRDDRVAARAAQSLGAAALPRLIELVAQPHALAQRALAVIDALVPTRSGVFYPALPRASLVEALGRLLSGTNVDLATAALRITVKLPQTARPLARSIEAWLDDSSPEAVTQAALSVRAMFALEAVPALRRALPRSPAVVAHTLMVLVPETGWDEVAAMLREVNAGHALGIAGYERQVKDLLELLCRAHGPRPLSYALSLLGPEPDARALGLLGAMLVAPHRVPEARPFLERALKHEALAWHAESMLRRTGASPPAAAPRSAALESLESLEGRYAAAKTDAERRDLVLELGEHDGPEVLRVAREWYRATAEGDVLSMLPHTLARTQGRKAVPLLIELFDDGRAQAPSIITAVASAGGPQALAFIEKLSSSKAHLEAHHHLIVSAFQELADPSTVPLLKKLYARAPDDRLLEALVMIGTDEALAALDPLVRKLEKPPMLWGLQKVRSERSARLLMYLYETVDVRGITDHLERRLLGAVGATGQAAVIPWLEERLGDHPVDAALALIAVDPALAARHRDATLSAFRALRSGSSASQWSARRYFEARDELVRRCDASQPAKEPLVALLEQLRWPIEDLSRAHPSVLELAGESERMLTAALERARLPTDRSARTTPPAQ